MSERERKIGVGVRAGQARPALPCRRSAGGGSALAGGDPLEPSRERERKRDGLKEGEIGGGLRR